MNVCGQLQHIILDLSYLDSSGFPVLETHLTLEKELFVKAEKCDFHVSIVSFLGFVIEKHQIKSDPIKIKAVT